MGDVPVSDTGLSATDTGATPGQGQGASGDASPNDVGKTVTSPWVPGHPVTITQQYGATSYSGEPSGHGAPHWHAGVDLGYPSNTVVQFPVIAGSQAESMLSIVLQVPILEVQRLLGASNSSAGVLVGTFHRGAWDGRENAYIPDPQGYGAHAATITINALGRDLFDVLLGHAVSWDQQDGAAVRAGDHLIHVDSEGNSTGAHLHFEVRPVRGGYGSDKDPWQALTTGTGAAIAAIAPSVGADVQAAANAISQSITGAVHDAESLALGLALSGLGVGTLGATLWLAFRGVKPPAMPAPTGPRGAPPPAEPVHPAARVARASRAAPAPPPRIPTTPSQAAAPRVRPG